MPGGKPRVEFEYNGLNWRTVKRSDTAPSTPYLNQHRIMYYSAEWQLLEEHIDDSFNDQTGFNVDRRMQYVWGLRYIDDIVLRQQDSSANGTFDTQWYHCTDTLFSTVAVLSDTAALVERVSYDAYGMARHHHAADINGDGAVTQTDYDIVTANLGNFGVGNITRTGTVGGRDQSLANDSLAALPPGEISKTDNIVGYAGYLFNAEIHGAGMYTVRHRHYAPDLGRWLTRDPAGYVDGMNLYEYVRSAPIVSLDPQGLKKVILYAVSPYPCPPKDRLEIFMRRLHFDGIGYRITGIDTVITQAQSALDDCDDADCISELEIHGHGSHRGNQAVGNHCPGDVSGGSSWLLHYVDDQGVLHDNFEEISGLRDLMCDGATVTFYGCNVGRNRGFLKRAADVIGVRCSGYTEDVEYSSDGKINPGGQKVTVHPDSQAGNGKKGSGECCEKKKNSMCYGMASQVASSGLYCAVYGDRVRIRAHGNG